MKINSVRNVFKYFLHGAQGHFLFMLVTGPKDSMWDWFRYTLQVFTRFCLDTSIVFAIITGNLITRSDTAISTNFVQSKTIQESLKHVFIIFMQQDNVFTKTENCHSAHICPQCRALSLSFIKQAPQFCFSYQNWYLGLQLVRIFQDGIYFIPLYHMFKDDIPQHMSAASLYTMNYRKSTTNLIILMHE